MTLVVPLTNVLNSASLELPRTLRMAFMVIFDCRLDSKIAKLDVELRRHRETIKSLGSRAGPSLEQAKRRALNTLKQKRMLEDQRAKIQDNVMRIDEARYTTSAMQDQADMVKALKLASKEMKAQMKKTKELDPDHVADIMDEIQEQKDYFDEIQMAMSSYDAPVDIDDQELMAEMEMLGDDIAEEALGEDTPAYMMDIPDAPQDHVGVPESDGGYAETQREHDKEGIAL